MIVLLAACGAETDPVLTWTTGDGVACVSGADGTYTVVVDFQEYVQCASDDAFTCAVEVDGDRLVVTAEGRVDTSTCPPAGTVASAVARCEPLVIEGGAYVLVYGPDEVALELPLGDETVCTGPLVERS